MKPSTNWGHPIFMEPPKIVAVSIVYQYLSKKKVIFVQMFIITDNTNIIYTNWGRLEITVFQSDICLSRRCVDESCCQIYPSSDHTIIISSWFRQKITADCYGCMFSPIDTRHHNHWISWFIKVYKPHSRIHSLVR